MRPHRRYVDYPITDVLQMMGRAGRPQYDRHGVAVIMVHEPKKSFYKKFLYEPFPVESSLPGQLADHVNAEAVGGTIRSTQDAVDYLTWTFFMRRLLQNPSYYDLDSVAPEAVSSFLSDLVDATLGALEGAGCLAVDEAGGVAVLTPGRIASFYDLRHATLATFARELRPGMGPPDVLRALCAAAEYAELPVRHNEDRLNAGLAAQVRHPPDARTMGELRPEGGGGGGEGGRGAPSAQGAQHAACIAAWNAAAAKASSSSAPLQSAARRLAPFFYGPPG